MKDRATSMGCPEKGYFSNIPFPVASIKTLLPSFPVERRSISRRQISGKIRVRVKFEEAGQRCGHCHALITRGPAYLDHVYWCGRLPR